METESTHNSLEECCYKDDQRKRVAAGREIKSRFFFKKMRAITVCFMQKEIFYWRGKTYKAREGYCWSQVLE